MPDRPPTTPAEPDPDPVGRRIRAAALRVEAPPALRERLAEQERQAARRRARGGRLPAVAAAAGAGLAVLAVIALVVGGGSSGPSVDDAAALALARPTDPPPALDASDSTRVQAAVGGVAFPNYAYTWPKWRAAGARRDTIDGRAATTVTYRGPRGDVGYTIVDGEPLPEPDGARHVTVDGVRLAVVRRDGATVVTWRRGGHTCVLASRERGAEPQLIRFATWA